MMTLFCDIGLNKLGPPLFGGSDRMEESLATLGMRTLGSNLVASLFYKFKPEGLNL